MAERVTAATVNSRIDNEVLPAIQQLGKELKKEIQANSLNGMRVEVEQIVAERRIAESQEHKRRAALAWIADDVLHVGSWRAGWRFVKYLAPFALGAFFWRALPAHLVIGHIHIW